MKISIKEELANNYSYVLQYVNKNNWCEKNISWITLLSMYLRRRDSTNNVKGKIHAWMESLK